MSLFRYTTSCLLFALLLTGCMSTKPLSKMKTKGKPGMWRGVTSVTVINEQNMLGVRDKDGNTILPTEFNYVHRIGDVYYARPVGETTFRSYALSKVAGKIVVAPPKSTPYAMIEAVPKPEPGGLFGVGYAWPDSVPVSERKESHNRLRDAYHLNVDGEVIAVYPGGGIGLRTYHDAYRQYVPNGAWIFIDGKGRPLTPPLKNLQEDRHNKLMFIPVKGDLIIPILPGGTLPVMTKGFQGFEAIGPKSRAARFWLIHYNVDGRRQIGYATADLSTISGPLWSEWDYWDMGRPSDFDRQFVSYYPAGECLYGKSLEDNQWRLYKIHPYSDHDDHKWLTSTKGMPEVVGGPAPTKAQASADEEALVKESYALAIDYKLGANRQANEKRAAEREAAAKRAEEIAKRRAQEEADRKAAWLANKAKRDAYLPAFKAAMDAGNAEEAKRLMWLAKGDTYGVYLLKFEPFARPHIWVRAANSADTVTMRDFCRRKSRERRQEELEQRARNQQNDARQAAELAALRGDKPIATFSWDDFWNNANAAQAQQQQSSDPDAQKRYIKSLQDYTYGEQDWHYTAPK